MADLAVRADVEHLVSTFYEAAFQDPLIGPVFTEIAKMDLDHHLPIMCDFWETVLFNAGLYQRNALQVHVALHSRHALGADHFERWVTLWSATVDARFSGPIADRAKVQASRISESLQRRLAGRSGSLLETIGRREGMAPAARVDPKAGRQGSE